MSPRDVTAEEQRQADERVRRLSEAEKTPVIDDRFWTARKMAAAGIREKNPGASDQLLDWLVVEHVYGTAVANRLRGARPAR